MTFLVRTFLFRIFLIRTFLNRTFLIRSSLGTTVLVRTFLAKTFIVAPNLSLTLHLQVLVFSQSLLSLDLIEAFLSLENDNRKDENGLFGTWVNGQDYYRVSRQC